MPSGNLCYIPRHHYSLKERLTAALQDTDFAPAPTVSIYCDASTLSAGFNEYNPGAWAFYIPSLSMEYSGIEVGLSNTALEMLAAIQGLECATASGHSKDILAVCSDCNYTEAWIKELNYRLTGVTNRSGVYLPSCGKAHDKAVIDRLLKAMSISKVKFVRTTSSGSEHHQRCHTLARHTLKTSLTPDQRKSIVGAAKLAEIRKQRERLAEKLAAVDLWLAEHSEFI